MSAKPQSRRNGEQPVSLLDTLKEAAESQKNLVELPLRSILLDQTFQVRVGGLDADHLANLRALVDSGGQFKDPIIVYDTPVGRFLTDGWHRYTIAMEFNWVTIPAELRSGTYEQALDAAEEANLHHGKMLSNEDKKNLLIRRLGRGHAWVELSSREIGRQLGVGKDTVRRWIDDYNATGAFAPVERTTTKGADGKTRNTDGIRDANKEREKTTGKNLPVTPAQQRNQEAFIAQRLETLSILIHDLAVNPYRDEKRLAELRAEKERLETNGSYREAINALPVEWLEANEPEPGERWDGPPFVSLDDVEVEDESPLSKVLRLIKRMESAREDVLDILIDQASEFGDAQAMEIFRAFKDHVNGCGELLLQMKETWGVR